MHYANLRRNNCNASGAARFVLKPRMITFDTNYTYCVSSRDADTPIARVSNLLIVNG